MEEYRVNCVNFGGARDEEIPMKPLYGDKVRRNVGHWRRARSHAHSANDEAGEFRVAQSRASVARTLQTAPGGRVVSW